VKEDVLEVFDGFSKTEEALKVKGLFGILKIRYVRTVVAGPYCIMAAMSFDFLMARHPLNLR